MGIAKGKGNRCRRKNRAVAFVPLLLEVHSDEHSAKPIVVSVGCAKDFILRFDCYKAMIAQQTLQGRDQMNNTLRVAKRLLSETLPPRWKKVALTFFCIVGIATFTAALAYSTRLIVNDVFVADDATAAVGVALLVMGVAITKSIFEYANSVVAFSIKRSISSEYQKRAFHKVIMNDMVHFFGKHASKQMAQIRLLGNASGSAVVGISNRLFVDALTVAALVAVMILQDPLMSLATAVLFPMIIFLVGFLSRKVRALAGAENELTGAVFAVGSEAFQGIKTVKSYGLESKSIERFDDAVDLLEERLLGFSRITSTTIPVMEAIGGVVIGLFVIYASWQTITQGQSPGEFTAFITAFLLAYQPAERLSKTWVELQKSIFHVERLYAILDAPTQNLQNGTEHFDRSDLGVEFRNVNFEYVKNVSALTNVSFEIAAAERVAIVGRSGAGKSTLTDLILRFYDPSEGSIHIGGLDLKDVRRDSIQQAIAYINQDVFLFDGSIRENIRDGDPSVTDEEIDIIAERAQLKEMLADRDEGLDAQVGPNGANLSGGQRQRGGIARAIAKKSRIYIFDEATGALDAQNERLIMSMIADHLDYATVVFVTHRLSTLHYVDRILMLDNGRVAGFDSHAELARSNAAYRKLFNLDQGDSIV